MPATTDATERGSPASDSTFRADEFDRLAEARGARTETAKAALAAVDRTTLYRLRKGQISPNVSLAMRMARALGVPVEHLFGERA